MFEMKCDGLHFFKVLYFIILNKIYFVNPLLRGGAAFLRRPLQRDVGQICYNELKVIVLISKGSPVFSKWALTLFERAVGTLCPRVILFTPFLEIL